MSTTHLRSAVRGAVVLTSALALVAGSTGVVHAQTEGATISPEALSSDLEAVTGSVQQIDRLTAGTEGKLDGGSVANLRAFLEGLQDGHYLDAFRVLQAIPGGLDDIVAMSRRAARGEVGWDRVLGLFEAVLAPVQPCNVASDAGSVGTRFSRHELGRRGPARFTLRYDTYQIPDSIYVYYGGELVYSDVNVSTRGERFVDIALPPGNSTSANIRLEAPNAGTEWNYTVGCGF